VVYFTNNLIFNLFCLKNSHI